MFAFKTIINFLLFTFDVTNGIIDGNDSLIEDIPYQVSIEINEIHSCGGSIISPNFILTAGHCFMHVTDVGTVRVRAGSSTSGEGGYLAHVQRIILRPYFNYTMFGPNEDVAILQLSTSLRFSSKIAAVKLADYVYYFPSWTFGTVSGWGFAEKNDKTVPKMLQYTRLPIWSNGRCDFHGFKQPKVLCVEISSNYGKTFMGDDGGPLVVNNVLHGIIPEAALASLTMYRLLIPFTGVGYFRDWIRNVTGV